MKIFFNIENVHNVFRIDVRRNDAGQMSVTMRTTGGLPFGFPVSENFPVPNKEAAEAVIKLLGILLNCQFHQVDDHTYQKILP